MTWAAKSLPFTKYTDFVGEIRIAGLDPSIYDGSTLVVEKVVGDANIAELVRLITKYEKRILTKLLTASVYDQFVTAMTGSTTPDAKWTDLYSQLYTNPIVANYVYYWHQRDIVTNGGTVGEVKANQENAANDSPAVKMCRAWNENWELILAFDEWYDDHQADYGFVRTESEVFGVMYGYLAEFQPINQFGI